MLELVSMSLDPSLLVVLEIELEPVIGSLPCLTDSGPAFASAAEYCCPSRNFLAIELKLAASSGY